MYVCTNENFRGLGANVSSKDLVEWLADDAKSQVEYILSKKHPDYFCELDEKERVVLYKKRLPNGREVVMFREKVNIFDVLFGGY